MGSILGNRVLRVEDPRMLTVGGTYVEDVEFAGALVPHVRPVARRPRGDRHDRLRRRARAARASSPSSPAPTWRPGSAAPDTSTRCSTTAMRRPFVADERVHYVGQPVVAIVSETRAVGMDAADLVDRRLRPAARRDRPRGVATRRGAAPPRCRHERRPSRGDADARRLRRLRGGRRGADRQPAADGGAHRAPLGRRLLDRRRTPRALRGLPGSAPHPRLARRRVRPREVAGARRSRPTSVAASAPSRGRIPRSWPSASTPGPSAGRCAGPRPAPRT